ncbi:MAG: hypothetical protein AAGI37_08415 [Planctomycetota bacterium]
MITEDKFAGGVGGKIRKIGARILLKPEITDPKYQGDECVFRWRQVLRITSRELVDNGNGIPRFEEFL